MNELELYTRRTYTHTHRLAVSFGVDLSTDGRRSKETVVE